MSEDYWIENDILHFDDLYDCIVPIKSVRAMKKCQSIHFGMEFNKIIYPRTAIVQQRMLGCLHESRQRVV